MRAGDRIRITLEGEIQKDYDDGHMNVVFDGSSNYTSFEPGEIAAATIEVISQTFKIDDKVSHVTGGTDNNAVVKGVDGDRVWVLWPSGNYADGASKNFRRLDDE
jgi:hypothetical protein